MYDFYTYPDESLSLGLQTFKKILKTRGWPKAELLKGKFHFLTLTRPDGKIIETSAIVPPTATYRAAAIANDKLATYFLLNSHNIKQPETVEFTNLDSIKPLLNNHKRLVIKPSDSSHGDNVYTDITSLDSAEKVLKISKNLPSIKPLLAQEQLTPTSPEIRVICIDGKFIAAYSRIPAKVTGDGVHSVSELIEIENETIRSARYRSNLTYIDVPAATIYLKKHHLADKIPDVGEKVQVISTCNMGQGGTMEDLTDQFSDRLKTLSEKIAKISKLPVLGIDFLDDYVLEINSSPMLYYPVEGRGATICIEKLVDYLETL